MYTKIDYPIRFKAQNNGKKNEKIQMNFVCNLQMKKK